MSGAEPKKTPLLNRTGLGLPRLDAGPEPKRIALADARGWSERVLRDAGLGMADAAKVADVLVRTSARGAVTHGIRMLPFYVEKLGRGGINPTPGMRVTRPRPATAVLDGDGGCGHLVALKAVDVGVAAAQEVGVSIVVARDSNHFGAAGHYALLAAEAGCIALVWSNTATNMRVTGSRGRVLGNSPTAYGIPNPRGVPVVFDIAMSAAAGSKVHMAAERGEEIPLGWLVDSDGAPTTDPRDYTAGGALEPVGDHKGYGFALLGETLAGVLSGAAIASAVLRSMEQRVNVGHAFVFVDVASVTDYSEYDERIAQLVAEIHESAPAPGVERIYLPGEMEHESEQRAAAEGLLLDEVTYEDLVGLNPILRSLVTPATDPDGPVREPAAAEER